MVSFTKISFSTMFGVILWQLSWAQKLVPLNSYVCMNVKFLRFMSECMDLCVQKKDNKSQINCLIFLLVRNSLADSKGTRQEIGPAPLISPMMDLWGLPEMEGKGIFPTWLDYTTSLRKESVCVWESEKVRVKDNTSFEANLGTTQPCMCGLVYAHESPQML